MSELWIDARTPHPGTLTPPPSKSDAHRALVIAHALGRPELVSLSPVDLSLPDDVRVLSRGLAELRADARGEIDCHDGGAPLRFLLAQAAITPGARVQFVGTPRLGERPHLALIEALRELGADVRLGDPWPIEVRGVPRPVRPQVRIAASQSSQFVSALLLASASLVASGRPGLELELEGAVASPGYLALTVHWLRRSGFEVREVGSTLTVARAADVPARLPAVPADWSSLGYLLPIAWATGSALRRVDPSADHPDRAILRVLTGIGLEVHTGPDGLTTVTGTPTAGLRGSGAESPDLLPTLAVLACALPAPSVLERVDILRVKESDRLTGIRDLAAAAGARLEAREDALTIHPPVRIARTFAASSRSDHRMAMSAATLAVLGRSTLRLEGAESVTKSFPAFWEELARCGVRVGADTPPRG